MPFPDEATATYWLQHTNMALTFEIEIAQEDDGRWIAEVPDHICTLRELLTVQTELE